MISKMLKCAPIIILILILAPTLQVSMAVGSPSAYSVGFATGKQDAKKNVYDVTNACNYGNWTSDQTYACLNGYYDGNKTPYRAGYLQGVQGIEFKGFTNFAKTPEFIKGYSKGIQGYWSNRALVEGYSGLPISSFLQKNANYTQSYKDGRAEYLAGYPGTKKCGIDLGTLPAHTNDNYRDFYLGLDQGGDAYNLVDGLHRFLENGPPGHTAEYYAGWKFGYGLGLSFDSDCGGVAVVS